jgi:hypothetical protein
MEYWNIGYKIWGALPIIVRGMYRVGCHFDKLAHLFVDLPATKAIFSGIQADLSFTLTIYEALCMNVLIPGIFRVPIKVIITHRNLVTMQK